METAKKIPRVVRSIAALRSRRCGLARKRLLLSFAPVIVGYLTFLIVLATICECAIAVYARLFLLADHHRVRRGGSKRFYKKLKVAQYLRVAFISASVPKALASICVCLWHIWELTKRQLAAHPGMVVLWELRWFDGRSESFCVR